MPDKEVQKISPEAQKRLDEALDELFKKRREEDEKRKKQIINDLKDHSDDRPFSL